MEPIWEYTIKLIRFVLNGDVPELPENIDFEKLFAFGKSHGVENMLYVGLRDLHIDVPEETMQKFKTAYEMQIMVEATQALELEAISEAFEEAGIDHVPLKGSVIKYLYPMPDYRKSGDIDILIRPEDEAKADRVLKSLGFDMDSVHNNHEIHSSYKKDPFIEIELHRRLTRYNDRSNNFFKDVWQAVENDKYGSCVFKMSCEYLYTYLMAHLCKHLCLGGAGIRLITDLYVVRCKCDPNNDILRKHLKRSNLYELNRMVTEIIGIWFENCEEISDESKILSEFIFQSGSFGTKEMYDVIISTDDITHKLKKYIRRLFPPVRIIKNRFPIVEEKAWLLPFVWGYRIIHITVKEYDTISDKNKEIFGDSYKVNKMKKIVRAIRDN